MNLAQPVQPLKRVDWETKTDRIQLALERSGTLHTIAIPHDFNATNSHRSTSR